VTTSSQTTSGALPPENPPERAPLPLSEALASAPAVNPDVPHHLRARGPEPELPECFTCGTRTGALVSCPKGRRYESGAQVLYCKQCLPPAPLVVQTAGVLRAAMKNGAATPEELAQAEYDTGILFDAERAQDIAAAAAEQAHAEDAALVDQARRDAEALAWFHARYKAVQSLLFGRHDTDLMFVREILAALDPQRPADAPASLTWSGLVMGPSGDTEGERTLVPLNTSFGARAFLTLTDGQRLELASLLAQPLRTGDGCATPGCGMADEDLDASDPTVTGWVLADVAGSSLGARWYCTPLCASAAITAAGAELADDDQAAAVDPDQHGYTAPAEDDVARCARCRCTDNAACEGGCAWLPNDQGIDLCSACATPAELAAAGWAVCGE
jgi:hypothetical protein